MACSPSSESSKAGQTPSVCISPPPPSAVQGPELTGQLLQLAGGSGSPRHHLATAQNKDAEDSLLFLPSFLLQFVPSAMLGWWSILAIMELPPQPDDGPQTSELKEQGIQLTCGCASENLFEKITFQLT